MRRGVNMVYIVENNGVYGLTKGQFSATADNGSKSKKGAVNTDEPIDLAMLAHHARRDVRRARLLRRQGASSSRSSRPRSRTTAPPSSTSISPCVAFNNHAGSTKSYDYVREHNEAVNFLDFISPRDEITTTTRPARSAASSCTTARRSGCARSATTTIRNDRVAAMNFLEAQRAAGEVVTGLLYLHEDTADMHDALDTVDVPLNALDRRRPRAGQRGTRGGQREPAVAGRAHSSSTRFRAAVIAIRSIVSKHAGSPAYGGRGLEWGGKPHRRNESIQERRSSGRVDVRLVMR